MVFIKLLIFVHLLTQKPSKNIDLQHCEEYALKGVI